MKIIVTGGGGFAGKILIELLLSHNHDVWVLVNEENIFQEYQHKGVHAVRGVSYENASWIDTMPHDAEYIVNIELPNIPPTATIKNLSEIYGPQQLKTAQNLAYLAERLQCKRIYTVASIQAYKQTNNTEHNELDSDPHGLGIIDSQALGFYKSSKIPVTTLMYGTFLYNSQLTTYPVPLPTLFKKLPIIVGNGESQIQLTQVEDLVYALVFAMENSLEDERLNVVDNRPIALKDLMGLFAQKTGKLNPISLPTQIASYIIGDAVSNTLSESKTAKNDLLKSKGYWLRFPDYQAGISTT